MKAPFAVLVAATLLTFLAGCAKDGGDATQVKVTEYAFTPNAVSVDQNDRVEWTNDGDMEHSVTIHKAGDSLATSKKGTDIDAGASTEYKFEETGTFHVYCKYHSGGAAGDFGTGMVMTVMVD